MTPFEQAFAVLIGHEGGYDTTRADPGNWTSGIIGTGELRGTKYGISASAYPDIAIKGLSLADAQAVYKRDYWDPILGDILPPALALLVFDAAVNNGKARAANWLHIAVGTRQDGRIGPETIEALKKTIADKGGASVCSEFMAQRMCFMANLPNWRIFGLGWSRRLSYLPYQAMMMGVL